MEQKNNISYYVFIVWSFMYDNMYNIKQYFEIGMLKWKPIIFKLSFKIYSDNQL